MIYRVIHKTVYDYEDPVSVSHHALRLSPRELPNQTCTRTQIRVIPHPSVSTAHTDYFGNPVTLFTLDEPHDRLEVEAESTLEVTPRASLTGSPSWESITPSLEAVQYVYDSKRIEAGPKFAAYAAESFAPGRPLAEAAQDLMHRIHRQFTFDSKATEVNTPTAEVLEKRRGVCQDFAHLQIACLRSMGIPARYVSGYLRTQPPPGKPRLIGADASHAWCAAWCPMNGWIDLDPTNDVVPSEGHVTIAWGRDYTDVSPIHGVLLGGAHHTLHVGVDVMPL